MGKHKHTATNSKHPLAKCPNAIKLSIALWCTSGNNYFWFYWFRGYHRQSFWVRKLLLNDIRAIKWKIQYELIRNKKLYLQYGLSFLLYGYIAYIDVDYSICYSFELKVGTKYIFVQINKHNIENRLSSSFYPHVYGTALRFAD